MAYHDRRINESELFANGRAALPVEPRIRTQNHPIGFLIIVRDLGRLESSLDALLWVEVRYRARPFDSLRILFRHYLPEERSARIAIELIVSTKLLI